MKIDVQKGALGFKNILTIAVLFPFNSCYHLLQTYDNNS